MEQRGRLLEEMGLFIAYVISYQPVISQLGDVDEILIGCHWKLSVVGWILPQRAVWLVQKNRATLSTNQGPIVRKPVIANPGLNFNPGFYISLIKSRFGIIFQIAFRAWNHKIVERWN